MDPWKKVIDGEIISGHKEINEDGDPDEEA